MYCDDMENWVKPSRSPKSNELKILTIPMIQYIEFGLNPSFGSRDRVQTSIFWSKFDIQNAGVFLEIRPRSSKSNIFFTLSKWCFCASLVRIHALVH